MKLSEVLIKPVLTEKANKLQEKRRTYSFKVDKRSNKLEIKKAIETFYGVNVLDVNTLVAPAKNKARNTKAGYIKGLKSGFKKAMVTIAEGEEIDLYTAI